MLTGYEYQPTTHNNNAIFYPPTTELQLNNQSPSQQVHQFIQLNPQGFFQQNQDTVEGYAQHAPQVFNNNPINYSKPPPAFGNISTGYAKPAPRVVSYPPTRYEDSRPMSPLTMTSPATNVIDSQPQVQLNENDVPYSYMVPAWFACFCCCWIVGIAAIIFASRSENESANRNYAEAKKSANTAKILTWISVVLGICAYIFIIVFKVVIYKH